MKHSGSRLLTVGAVVALAACNPFHSGPVVSVSGGDVNANSRWNGTLITPSSLSGAVQIKGTATMTPGSSYGNTAVAVNISNALPGGVHPWQVHRGQCGNDDGMLGRAGDYKEMKVDDKGRATSSTTLPFAMPLVGAYYVSVGASDANSETIVACGNLAPPSR